jgi:hypothetical protein
MTRGTRFGWLGALALLGSALAACGGSSSPPAANGHATLSVIDAAATATAAQSTMKVTGTIALTTSGGAGAGSLHATLSGVERQKPLAADFTVRGMSVGGQDVGTVRELITPTGFYLNMPLLTRQTGKPWAGISFAEINSASGVNFKQLLSQAQQLQPSQYVDQLAAAGDVKAVGRESVGGVETTHYAGDVKTADAVKRYSSSLRAQMTQLLQQAGVKSMHLEAWIDAKNLVRRIEVSTGSAAKFAMTMRMDVLAYGVPVHVTAPPPSQVADLAKLAQQG